MLHERLPDVAIHGQKQTSVDTLADRRRFLQSAAGLTATLVCGHGLASSSGPTARVHTVTGPVDPTSLGVTLMHEHLPIVDWSELFETPPADWQPLAGRIMQSSLAQVKAFQESLPRGSGLGAIVECTPIRVGRYPDLLARIAREAALPLVACTGFWGEAMAPVHLWCFELARGKGAPTELADVYIREIRTGMEDPTQPWGQRFTEIPAGIIKVATSSWMRPIERRCHEAAAIAARETGCPITSHTTDGGGLEEAQLLLRLGVPAERIIIGHQGHLDDRATDEATARHRQLADLGVAVQFDRVGHPKYSLEKIGRQVVALIQAGHLERILLGHDLVPYVYKRFAEAEKPADGWEELPADLTTVPVRLAAELARQGVTPDQLQTIQVANPRRVLAF